MQARATGIKTGKEACGFRCVARIPSLTIWRLSTNWREGRIDRFQPEQSLLLLKPMAEIAHQGGKRFDIKSPEYAMLCQWIGDALQDPIPVRRG